MGEGLKGRKGRRGGGGEDGGIIEKVRDDRLDRSANSADGAKTFGGRGGAHRTCALAQRTWHVGRPWPWIWPVYPPNLHNLLI